MSYKPGISVVKLVGPRVCDTIRKKKEFLPLYVTNMVCPPFPTNGVPNNINIIEK